jgi:hypothetical protein
MATLPDGRVLLYGGYQQTGPASFTFFDDTWIFDPATSTWTEQVGATVGPRSHATLAPAETGGDPILVAGFDGTGFVGTVHRWDGTAWVTQPGTSPPSARSAHVGFTFEPAGGNGVLVVGLGSGTTPPTDTKTLDP